MRPGYGRANRHVRRLVVPVDDRAFGSTEALAALDRVLGDEAGPPPARPGALATPDRARAGAPAERAACSLVRAEGVAVVVPLDDTVRAEEIDVKPDGLSAGGRRRAVERYETAGMRRLRAGACD